MATRELAPGQLLLVQQFVNTLDVETGADELGDAARCAEWLVDAGLLAKEASSTAADASGVVALREALRDLLCANAGGPLDGSGLRRLNDLSARLPLAVSFQSRESSSLLPVEPGVGGALAVLLGIVHTAMADGSWDRLKACREDTCRWVFYDQSRNRSSAWCSMAVCGNRAKARAYRSRARTEG
jgi:predicted RNA-binding Zn ribbon-like protein